MITRTEIIELIENELERAYAKHGKEPWGRHEWYAILKEEVDELWSLIKRDGPDLYVIEEAIQVAAMVVRYLETGDRYRGELEGPKELAKKILGECDGQANRTGISGPSSEAVEAEKDPGCDPSDQGQTPA